MGTPDFAVGSLQALVRAGHEVVLAVTQPDKPQGRKQLLVEPAVKTAAKELGIGVFQPRRVREPEALEEIRRYEPQLIVVAAFGQILPKELLDMPTFGCINVHASLLPKYRGAAPIQWAILNGDATTGVTIMRMDEGLDTGDMIAKTELAIDPEDTGGTLFDRLADAGAKLLVDTIPSIADGTATYTPQDASEATKVGQISKKDGEIDFTRSAKQIANQIRGLNPWPSAYTYLSGKTLKIWSASAVPGGNGAPGEITEITKNSFSIQTGDGTLICREVQLEGKKRMPAGDFLRGNALEAGMKF
jgi:methionyl-tRNA formyltransferase